MLARSTIKDNITKHKQYYYSELDIWICKCSRSDYEGRKQQNGNRLGH